MLRQRAQVHSADLGALLKHAVLNKRHAEQLTGGAGVLSLPEDAAP